MEQAINNLAGALRLAERAHAQREVAEADGSYTGAKIEWPEFYAQWLLDNAHIWANVHHHQCLDGSCEIGEAS